MILLDKFQPMLNNQAELAAMNIMPFGAVTEKLLSATEGVVNGKRVLLAGTNNYLGLSFHPECIRAAQQALDQEGTGTTGSRLANGTFRTHQLLEAELADFFGVERAIIFSTGYAATMGLAATLAGPGETILLDADSHASLYDGVKLSGAEIIRFRHNDPQDLEKRLRRLGERAHGALIIVEGIYSMGGDRAPLVEIAAIKRRYGCYLLVDEAHSLGVLGERGRGAAEAAAVEADIDFMVGTFSKSLGTMGGYCVSRHPELEAIRWSIRSYIFTASASPAVIAATRTALRLIREQPQLRVRLWDNAHQLYDGLQALGLTVGSEVSPVVAVTTESRAQALRWWVQLFDQGVYVNLVVPPASPTSASLLRCSVSAAYSGEQVQRIIEAFAMLQ
jgi:8-amino-7-oxononanoate synthase